MLLPPSPSFLLQTPAPYEPVSSPHLSTRQDTSTLRSAPDRPASCLAPPRPPSTAAPASSPVARPSLPPPPAPCSGPHPFSLPPINIFSYYIIDFSLDMGWFHLVKTTTIVKSLLRPRLHPGDFPSISSFFSLQLNPTRPCSPLTHTRSSCQTGARSADHGPLLGTLRGGRS